MESLIVTDDPSTIDELMDRILNNPDPSTLTPGDIDALIAYHRAQRESGAKPKRESPTGAAKAPTKSDTLDLLKSIGAIKPTTITPDASFRRRF